MAELTLLTANNGAKLAKTVTRVGDEWQKSSYDKAWTFDVKMVAVDGIADLSKKLIEIETSLHTCVIRGALKPGHRATNVRRLLHDDQKTGTLAPFQELAVQWVMIDIDDLPVPSDLTMAQRVAWMIRELPGPFQVADFHLHWSSGAGLDGWRNLRAHLWFWLSSPIRCTDLRAQANAEGWAADLSLFNPVQIHYTANPVFVGAHDPLAGQRSRLVHRHRRCVDLPPWSPPPPNPVWNGTGVSYLPCRTFEERLAAIGPRYHLPILQAAASYVAIHKTSADRWQLRQRLKDAIMAAPPGVNPKEGYLCDRYLDRVIDGAFRKYGH